MRTYEMEMKRTGILLSICLLCSSLLYAAPRTRQQAQAAAEQFVSHVAANGSKHAPKAQHLQWAHTVRMPQSATDLAYIFTPEQAEGFIIISADDCARTILGYANEGTFDADRIPENMQVWLQHYAEEIAYASQTGAAARAPQQTTSIAPLLSTTWNQSTPYNQLCPMDCDNTRSYTGCVATAMAQIMNYWQYPATGTGQHSYIWYNCSNDGQYLSTNFGTTTYDWAHMRDYYYSGSYTPTEATAVATLMYHIGVACEMHYGGQRAGGSGTNNIIAAQALFTYFGYDAGIRILRPDYIGNTAFENGVRAELQAARPVMITGYTEQYEGHAFVCDGMDNQGLFHINWGWGGYQDGYFALSALDPDDQGIGGAASGNGFHVMVSAIAGIRPNQGGTLPDHVEMGAQTLQLATRERTPRTRLIHIDMPDVTNLGLEAYEGRLGIVVTDTTMTNIIQWFGYDDIDLYFNFQPGYSGGFYYEEYISNLAPGYYELVPAYTNADQTRIYRMPIIEEPKSLRIEVTTDSVFFNPTEDESDPIADHWPFTHASVDYLGSNNRFLLRLTTNNAKFDQTGDHLTKGYMLQLALRTEDIQSIVGTYRFNPSALSTVGTFAKTNSGIYIRTNENEFTGGEVTIAQTTTGGLSIAYALNVNTTFYGDTVTIERSNITYDCPQTMTNQHVTALQVSQAIPIAQNLPAGNRSSIPYLVRGIVCGFNNSPAQIAQYGTAQYYISDDGTGTQQIYCFRNYWLNNTPFKTGYEIALGDTVVVYAPLYNYQGTTPEVYYSYIYQHSPYNPYTNTSDVPGEPTPCTKFIRDGILYIRNGEHIYPLRP